MDVRLLLVFVCLCTLFFPLEGLVLQSETNGISVHAIRRPLSLGNRQVLAIKAQDEKGQQAQKHNTTSTSSEKITSAGTKPVDDTGHVNSTDTTAKSGNKETGPISAPPPPPKAEDAQPASGKESKVDNASPDAEKPDGQKKDSSTSPEKKPDGQKKDSITSPEKKPAAPAIHCGESHCEDPKNLVSACLRIPGDGALKLSLFITSEKDSEVSVKVVAPEYLTANPLRVSVSKGKSETIQFFVNSKFEPSILDSEAAKNKNITVITNDSECEIAVPLDYLRSSALERKPQFSSYLPLVTPRAVAYLAALVLVVALVGTWLCCKCYRKKRGVEVKYQQLEMIAPGQGTPKEREQLSTTAWDEDWDDDWDDAEAAKSSSRLSQNLSSRNMGARRNNKENWDNSWED